MIIIMSTLGLTSSDLDTGVTSSRQRSANMSMSAMRFESGPNRTIASVPGLTNSHTTSGYSTYPSETADSSFLDIHKAGEIRFASDSSPRL